MNNTAREVAQRIDLRALAEQAGAEFRGNASRCPLHGGDNPRAFSIFQAEDGRWCWKCFTNCPDGQDHGDAIDFYMYWKNVDFKTALQDLARRVGVDLQHPDQIQPVAPPLPPKPIEPPQDHWQARAEAFLGYTQTVLWESGGSAALGYLHAERGLVNDTIRAWGLGYNPQDIWDKPPNWGLTGDRKIWLPRGIVIPIVRDGQIWNVKVRRPLPGDALASTIGAVNRLTDLKFCSPRGGKAALFGADKLADHPVLFLTEGEWDAMLAWQAIGDLADVATLGGSKHKLDTLDLASLLSAWRIVILYDADAAGREGAKGIQAISSRAQIVEPPDHDLTDYHLAGGHLRPWLASIVTQQLEKILNDLDQQRYEKKWIDLYQQHERAYKISKNGANR
jgi:hypothetical protein